MSFNKTKKEILTDDLIKQDILNLTKNNDHVPIDIILTVISVMMILPLGLFSLYAWFAFLIPVFLFGLSHIVRRRKREAMKKTEFFVTADKLLCVKTDEFRTEPSLSVYKPMWNAYLQFENHGRWEPDGIYYTWSNLYKMSDDGIFYRSLVGDTFYLAIDKKNGKILVGYSTKFFDYQNF